MYNAKIIADSLNPQGDRITTFVVTYPRIIHAEMCRHRMHSRNTASSRAIPFEKMVKDVEINPFIPLAWQKSHKGMQGSEYFTDDLSIQFAISNWLSARDNAIKGAMSLHSTNNGYGSVTKQLCNRLLEPFVWTTELITATEWDNFFDLRCPQYNIGEDKFYKSKKEYLKYFPESKEMQNDDLFWLKINKSPADIHIQAIAELMYDAYNESTPKQLENGQWHIPFGNNIEIEDCFKAQPYRDKSNNGLDYYIEVAIKIATARAARISYTTLGANPKIDYSADIKLHNRLLAENHMSPFEHACKAMNNEEYEKTNWNRNFKGFISYRHIIETEK
jgi:hypothetical protein